MYYPGYSSQVVPNFISPIGLWPICDGNTNMYCQQTQQAQSYANTSDWMLSQCCCNAQRMAELQDQANALMVNAYTNSVIPTKQAEIVNPICAKIDGPVIIDYGADIDNAQACLLTLKTVDCAHEGHDQLTICSGAIYEPLTLDDLYKIAFPVDPIQDYFSIIYDRIEKDYIKQIDLLNRIKTAEIKERPKEKPKEKPKPKNTWLQVWKDIETDIAKCILAVYALFFVLGIFFALPVSLWNFSAFITAITIISIALLLIVSIFLPVCILAVYGASKKEKGGEA